MTPEKKQVIKTWIAAALWIGIIAVESTPYFSADNTYHYLYPLFNFLFSLEPKTFEVVNHSLRKVGHFIGYFTLSLLMFRAWKSTAHLKDVREWTMRWAGTAWVISVIIASLDEWHQTFLPSRTGRFADVILDSFAALTAQVVIFYYWQRRSAKPKARAAAL